MLIKLGRVDYMRIDNSIYSLLNTNTNGLLTKLLLTHSNKRNTAYSQGNLTDSVSIGAGKQHALKQKMLSSVTEVNGQPVKQLTAENNTLTINKGAYYKFQTSEGSTVILTGDDKGNVYMPYDDLNLDDDSFSPSDYGAIDKVEKFFTYLSSDMSGYCVRINYSKEETKDMLAKVGIKPGWFEVNTGSKSNEFYMLDDGTIYPEYQVEAHRGFFNNYNFFNDGYTKDSVFVIDGKDYKLDDTGHLHIPEGTGCVMENVKMIK
jgi:hypothetical protein